MRFERGKDVKETMGIGLADHAMCHGSSILHIKTRYGVRKISIGNENMEEFLELWKEAPFKDEPRNKALSKRIRKAYKIRSPFAKPEIEKIVVTGWMGETHNSFKSVVLFPGLVREGECTILKYGKTYHSIPGHEFPNNYAIADWRDKQVKNLSQMMDSWTKMAESLEEMVQVMNEFQKIKNEI